MRPLGVSSTIAETVVKPTSILGGDFDTTLRMARYLVESVLGDQRFKVWSSPDGLRVAQLLPYAERVFVGSRTDLWTWNSDTDLAVHTPVDPAMNRAASRAREQILGNPVDLAARILRAVSNVAEVSVGAPQEVAARATYVLSRRAN